jgi:tetratricopeptide (TPR) repeat protein
LPWLSVHQPWQHLTNDKEAARAAYERGNRSYNLAEFSQALDAFKEAYRNYPEPSFLFNIAQCHRQLGDKPNAIRFYRTYIRETPNAPNREEVNRLISALERAVAKEQLNKLAQPGPAPAPAPAVAPTQNRADLVATAPPPPAKKPLVRRGWFWGAIVGGVAATGLAVGLGVGLTAQHDPMPTYGTILKN